MVDTESVVEIRDILINFQRRRMVEGALSRMCVALTGIDKTIFWTNLIFLIFFKCTTVIVLYLYSSTGDWATQNALYLRDVKTVADFLCKEETVSKRRDCLK